MSFSCLKGTKKSVKSRALVERNVILSKNITKLQSWENDIVEILHLVLIRQDRDMIRF
jgi:hypothetical protein